MRASRETRRREMLRGLAGGTLVSMVQSNPGEGTGRNGTQNADTTDPLEWGDVAGDRVRYMARLRC
jgi:hypothetical protein